ncbi:putative WD-repeat protein [Plasmodium gaboni]|uniref:Putative WD-repeat protein n=1 Tax=Plasmodium gaboni TaxID=647221 RepID=A0A151LL60_9APIC|nr:putative WD-repeat protein [Plasmodium gaboni]KYN99715.1 putative WD-repeat protein [Plasmodium gaboni]
MDSEDVVGDDEYLDEFSEEGDSNEFLSEDEKDSNDSKNEKLDRRNDLYEEKIGDDKKECDRNNIYNSNNNNICDIFNFKEEVLSIHKKNICCIKLIRNGSNLIISGNDNNVRIYEFKNMNRHEKRYTKLISVEEGSIIQSLDARDNYILIAHGNKCFVYNKNGEYIQNSIRGDMYIKDVNKTKGHTRQINCCKFHPLNEQIFISGSLDSTLRIWNMTTDNNVYGLDKELVHFQCIKIVNEKNLLSNNIISCDFTKDANSIIIGCSNGFIDIRNKISNDYIYNYKSSDYYIKKDISHKDSIIDILTCKKNKNNFFTRSMDKTIKYWDIRNLHLCLHTIEDVSTIYEKSNMSCFHNDKYLIIGTQQKKKKNINPIQIDHNINYLSSDEDHKKSKLNIKYHQKVEDFENSQMDYDFTDECNIKKKYKNIKGEEKNNNLFNNNYIKVYKGDEDMNNFLTEMSSLNKIEKNIFGSIQIYDIENNFNLVYTKNYERSGIICTYYDEYIKQLFLGTTDGTCLIYYDENSKKGVLDYLQQKSYKRKEESKENSFFYMKNDNIYNLDNLPNQIQITQSGNVIIKKNNLNNKKIKINPTVKSLYENAYEKKSNVNAYSKFITHDNNDNLNYNHHTNNHSTINDDNIVEVLRNRELNKKGDDYFMKAYKYTQPNKIIDYSSEEVQEYSNILKRPKCPQCGIKNCVCGYMKNK